MSKFGVFTTIVLSMVAGYVAGQYVKPQLRSKAGK